MNRNRFQDDRKNLSSLINKGYGATSNKTFSKKCVGAKLQYSVKLLGASNTRIEEPTTLQ
jgi:hypothetical protein